VLEFDEWVDGKDKSSEAVACTSGMAVAGTKEWRVERG
jgi:hypothetical protein